MSDGLGNHDGAYYNENDAYCAQWLRNLIAAGHIAPGDVDERSIVDVRPADLAGYTQCHFFAGIGGWSYAASLAGWADDREIWTGSCPCQPYSVAGAGRGADDERHLWPHLFRLVSACRPVVLMGERVAAAVGKDWLDGVFADLEGVGYACGAVVVPACAVNAPHRRDRLWFVAESAGARQQPAWRESTTDSETLSSRAATIDAGAHCGPLADADQQGRDERAGTRDLGGGRIEPPDGSRALADTDQPGSQGRIIGRHGACERSTWATCVVGLRGADGKSRRIPQSGVRGVADGAPASMVSVRAGDDAAQAEIEMIPLLANGVAARVGKLRAFGNAIVPAVAAEAIAAWMDVRP